MQVPEEVEARDLDVSLQPFNIRVAHKHTSEVSALPELLARILFLIWRHILLVKVTKRDKHLPRTESPGANSFGRYLHERGLH